MRGADIRPTFCTWEVNALIYTNILKTKEYFIPCPLILKPFFDLCQSRRASLRMYNTLVERCFMDCVDTFRRKTLDKQEETCVKRCAEKFLKHSMRFGMRFAELNQGAATPD